MTFIKKYPRLLSRIRSFETSVATLREDDVLKNSQKQQGGGKVVSPQKKTRHHMIPASRLNENEKRRASRTVIKTVERFRHDAWHYVFDTLTPYEAALFILLRLAPKQFHRGTVVAKWENRTYRFKLGDIIDKDTLRLIESTRVLYGDTFEESLRILFGGRDWCNAIAVIVEEWSPLNYFKFVNVAMTASDGSTSSYKHNPPKQKRRKKKERLRQQK